MDKDYENFVKRMGAFDMELPIGNDVADELAHYGVLGMKWGVRKSEKSSGTYTSNRTRKLNRQVDKTNRRASKAEEAATAYQAKGNTKKATKAQTRANTGRKDAKILSGRAKRSQTVDDLRRNAIKETSIGKSLVSEFLRGTNSATNKTLAQLRSMNGVKQTSGEKKAQAFVDTFLTGRHTAEAVEARKYIYK